MHLSDVKNTFWCRQVRIRAICAFFSISLGILSASAQTATADSAEIKKITALLEERAEQSQLNKLFNSFSDQQLDEIAEHYSHFSRRNDSSKPVINQLTRRWSKQNPRKALEYIRTTMLPTVNPHDAYPLAMAQWLEQDPDAAQAYMEDLRNEGINPFLADLLLNAAIDVKWQSGFENTLLWIKSWRNIESRLWAAEKLLHRVQNSYRLSEFAKWVKDQSRFQEARFLISDTAAALTQNYPVEGVKWALGLAESPARYLAVCKAFATMGEHHPRIGMQWFLAMPGRHDLSSKHQQQPTADISNRPDPIHPNYLKRDIVAAYIESVFAKQGRVHPLTLFENIKNPDPEYVPMLKTEVLRLARLKDPVQAQHWASVLSVSLTSNSRHSNDSPSLSVVRKK